MLTFSIVDEKLLRILDLKHIVPGFVLVLASCTYQPAVQHFDCEDIQLQIDGADLAQLRIEGRDVMKLPMDRVNRILIFARMRPGDDDERVVTQQMLRFDPAAGRLIYLENYDGTPLLLDRQCSRAS